MFEAQLAPAAEVRVLQMIWDSKDGWCSQGELVRGYAVKYNDGRVPDQLPKLLGQMVRNKQLAAGRYKPWWHDWLPSSRFVSGRHFPSIGYRAGLTKEEYFTGVLARVREKYFDGSAFAMLEWTIEEGGSKLQLEDIGYLMGQLDAIDQQIRDAQRRP